MADNSTKPVHVTVDPIMPDETVDSSEGGLDLVALGIAFAGQWRLALLVFAVVAAVCFGYVLRLKPLYVATATILPQEGRSSENLTLLFSRGGGAGSLYMGLLESRTVQDLVIQRANLLQMFHTSDLEAARGQLTGSSVFAMTGNGLMDVSVRNGSATDAALIANAYLDALQALNDRMGSDQSKTTRLFFEAQLQQERNLLIDAENRQKALQQKTGLVQPGSQISSSISSIQNTRQQIQALQVQRAAKLESETPQNPDIVALDSQIAQLRSQEITEETSGATGTPGVAPSAAQALDQNLELQRAERDVAYYNALVTSLGNEYETARLNEIAGRSAFQVVDQAIPPETRAWPPRKQYLLISLAFAILLGIVAVIIKLLSMRVMAHAATRERLRDLRTALR